jgi:hypothetical protein
MVDVAAVHVDVVERSNIVVDRDSDGPNDQYGGKEPERGQEQPLAPRLYESVLVDLSQPCVWEMIALRLPRIDAMMIGRIQKLRCVQNIPISILAHRC